MIGLVSQPPIKEIDASKNKCFHAEITIDYSDITYEFHSLTNELSADVNLNHGYNKDFFYSDGNNFLLKNPSEKNPISIADNLSISIRRSNILPAMLTYLIYSYFPTISP